MEYEIVEREEPATVRPMAPDLPPTPPRPPSMLDEALDEARAVLRQAQTTWEAQQAPEAEQLLRAHVPELEPSYLADIFTALADTVAAEPTARSDVEAAFAAATTEVDDFMR